MSDVPETQDQRQCGRVTARGHLSVAHVSYEGTSHEFVAIQRADGSWLVHGPGTVAVCLSGDVMVSWAEAILKAARPAGA